MKKTFLFSLVLLGLTSCDLSRGTKYDPNVIDGIDGATAVFGFEVDYKLTDSNVKTIHVKLNGSSGVDALFDTGCSGMSISKLEFANLLKAGEISANDRVGVVVTTLADGSQIKEEAYNLHKVSIMDKKGIEHVAEDVMVTVAENPLANVLIGNTVIDQWTRTGFTINFNSGTIRFQ